VATTVDTHPRDDRATSAGTRRTDIQGLRAVAVLLIVAYHAGLPASGGLFTSGLVPGGFIGVDVFFVVSGFVITGLLLPQVHAGTGISFSAFYERRARRLLPALALMLTIVVILSVLFLSPLGPQQQTAKTGAAASVFAANLQLSGVATGYFELAADHNALLHTWSLAVEEQFYLVFRHSFCSRGRLRGVSNSDRAHRHCSGSVCC
jgi:peptidoglycan/LPS O-acetylase OafA/YrhL